MTHREMNICAVLMILALLGALIWVSYRASRWLKHKAPQVLRDAVTSIVVLLLIAGACLSFKGGGGFGKIAIVLFWLLVAFYLADVFTKYGRVWKTKRVQLTHKEKGESRS